MRQQVCLTAGSAGGFLLYFVNLVRTLRTPASFSHRLFVFD